MVCLFLQPLLALGVRGPASISPQEPGSYKPKSAIWFIDTNVSKGKVVNPQAHPNVLSASLRCSSLNPGCTDSSFIPLIKKYIYLQFLLVLLGKVSLIVIDVNNRELHLKGDVFNKS